MTGAPSQYAPGQVLPGTVYRVVRHLATGGMGSVYDVEDVTVEKRYVLKTLHPQLISREDLARRMRDEAKALAKLHHPNIVDVITAGVTSDAVKMPFYVMERLNGQNLRVVLEKKSALEVAHSYRIAIDVADALEHAHENNIIHRDVKPENIFLHRNANGTTTTKLLDFGIVRLLDRKASHTHGKFIGTLRYASPEQITGGALGPATDIYSLGVVLFEMLAGCGPFDDAGDAYAIGAAHANQVAPPLSRFVRVAPDVERLVAATLAKRPEDRPRDCFAFSSALRRMLQEEEAAPRSATVANVLSVAAEASPRPYAQGALPATRAEASAVPSSGPTAHGMIPPSGSEDAQSSGPGFLPTNASLLSSGPRTDRDHHPATPKVDYDRSGHPNAYARDADAPVSPIAPTLAAASGHYSAPAHPQAAYGASQGPRPAEPQPAGARPIDRNAPTREAAPLRFTQRLASNDTRIEDPNAPHAPGMPGMGGGYGSGDVANDEMMRAAFGEPAPLIVPNTDAGANPSGVGDIVFPRGHGSAITGPLAAEARTRPPERGPFILIGAALVLAVAMVAGAIVLVKARGTNAASPATPPVTTAPLAAPSPAPAASSAPTAVVIIEPSTSVAAPVATPPPAPTPSASAAAAPTATVKGRAGHTSPGTPTTTTPASTKAQGPANAHSGHVPSVSFDP